MFRVQCQKMKKKLSETALSIRDKLIKSVETWCNDTVRNISETFSQMTKRIQTTPENEKELVAIKEFIHKSNTVTQIELMEDLKMVIKHQEMLDWFSFTYQEDDINETLYQKSWPMEIGNVIQEGKSSIADKEEQFTNRLDKEKEDFLA